MSSVTKVEAECRSHDRIPVSSMRLYSTKIPIPMKSASVQLKLLGQRGFVCSRDPSSVFQEERSCSWLFSTLPYPL